MRTMILMMSKCYSELIQIPTFEERLLYLQTHGRVGLDTFGPYRYLVEEFLQSKEWRLFRRNIIVRDNGCDLAHPGHKIPTIKLKSKKAKRDYMILIHHINPCTVDDIINKRWDRVMNEENVVTTIHKTHQQIHYGSADIVTEIYRERTPGDTCPWR